MQESASHVHVTRPVLPDRCRRAPDSSYDSTFGIHLCNVKNVPCFFRGPVYMLTGDTRHYECRKRSALEEDGAVRAH